MVGLCLDLKFELFLRLTGWNDDFLGDDHGRREGESDVAVTRSEALMRPAQRVGDLIEVGNVAVGDHVLGQRLHGVAFEAVCALAGLGQLDQLERGRADVDPD